MERLENFANILQTMVSAFMVKAASLFMPKEKLKVLQQVFFAIESFLYTLSEFQAVKILTNHIILDYYMIEAES